MCYQVCHVMGILTKPLSVLRSSWIRSFTERVWSPLLAAPGPLRDPSKTCTSVCRVKTWCSNAAPKLRVSRSLAMPELCRFGHVSSSSFFVFHVCPPFVCLGQPLPRRRGAPLLRDHRLHGALQRSILRHPWQPFRPLFCAMPSMSLLTLFFTHLWWLWWSPWRSSSGNS